METYYPNLSVKMYTRNPKVCGVPPCHLSLK
jgi:hypothetical protein